jgi:hypothetical protein
MLIRSRLSLVGGAQQCEAMSRQGMLTAYSALIKAFLSHQLLMGGTVPLAPSSWLAADTKAPGPTLNGD